MLDSHPGPTTPLRLATALQYAFPNGGMTVAGLRREAVRGRLVIERIANKDFTTLAAIEEMRRLCRVKVEDGGFERGRIAVRQLAESWNGATVLSAPGGMNIAKTAFLTKIAKRKADGIVERAARREASKVGK